MDSPIDYTSRDYESIRQALIDRIPSRIPEWTSRSPNDFGIIMLEMFAYVGDITNFYIDKVFNENFLSTASLRSSVRDIVEMLGYQPSRRSPAVGEVTINKDPSHSGSVIVPVGTKLATVDDRGAIDIIYEVTGAQGNAGADLVIPPESQLGVVEVIQGETIRDELVALSDGHIGQYHPLYMPNVYPSTVEVEVYDGLTRFPWRQVASLLDAGPGDFSFEVRTENNGSTWLKFGDGRNGRIPSISSEIRATYMTGLGDAGNTPPNTVSRLVDPIIGVGVITNASPITGGADDEDVDSMRRLAPKSIRSLTRAVTLKDYEGLALQIPSVAKASAYSEVPSLVSLYIVPAGGGPVPQILEDQIQEWFSDKVVLGSVITINSANDKPIYVSLDLQVLPGYERASVKLLVENAVRRIFRLSNVDLGGTITISDIYRAVSEIPGVDYMVLTTLSTADDSSVDNVTVAYNELPVLADVTVSADGGVV